MERKPLMVREQQWPVLHWGEKKICGERGQRDKFGREGYGGARWRIEEIVWKIKNISVGFF